MNDIEMIICISTIFLIILVVIVLFKKRGYTINNLKGKMGEHLVKKYLKMLGDNYKIFNDIYLDDHGKSVQIDHVVISQFGIFCIETKNYKGKIYGHSYEFYNPIKQNLSHLNALNKTLGIKWSENLVVFLNRASKLKIINNSTFCGYPSDAIKHILSFKIKIYTAQKVLELSNKLSSMKKKNTCVVRYKHLKQVKQNRNNQTVMS